MIAWLPRLVARMSATVHTKLLAAFLIIVVLLIIVGAVSLETLNETSRRADELLKLQRNIATYRQLQHDTTAQLYSVASALLVPEERTLEATLRQLNQFSYDVDRLQVAARDEVELLDRVQEDYQRFVQVVNQVVELIRHGKVAEGRELQLVQASPPAEHIERLMNELVNRAEADMVASIEASHEAYLISRWTVIGFAVGSVGLALLLGYAISLSLIGPVKQMDTRLQQIAAGEFSGTVAVENRDELGTLAANVNHMSEELSRLYQQLAEWNTTLEKRVNDQLGQLESLSQLKRFFSPQLAEAILTGGAGDPLASHRREVAVVFLDLRGFTAFAEISEPEEVMRVLREYHAVMGKLILAHEGTLERFTGDGMMIFFNDPVVVLNPVERALRMAIAMRDCFIDMSISWRKQGHDLGLGIGIAQGFATIGAIGFEGRLDYGAVGTVTNLAARLCGEAKSGQILTNRKTLSEIDELVETEPIGDLKLKGFANPVAAFNIAALKH